MARPTVLRLRTTWLNVHKWIGLCLAILIIPISLTGAALVWDGWLDQQLNPQRYDVSTGEPRLTPSQYADAAASRAGTANLIASLRYDEEGDGPIVATYAAETVNSPIRANLFSPGPVRTHMRAAAMPGEDADTLPHPTSIAPSILLLASPELTETGQIYDMLQGKFIGFRAPE